MTALSSYDSRQGSLKCSVNKAYAFITDFRNFGRFAGSSNITGWQADRESCSFNISMLGKVSVSITGKEETGKVVYQGSAAGNTGFTVTVMLSGNNTEPSEISINLSAYLNPVMKMMADKPVKTFLDLLISEIENFDEWDVIEK